MEVTIFESRCVPISFDSPNHVRPLPHSYFPRKLRTFYPAPCDTSLSEPPTPTVDFTSPIRNSVQTFIHYLLVHPPFHFPTIAKDKCTLLAFVMYLLRRHLFLALSQQSLPLTTKVLEPDGTDMASHTSFSYRSHQ